MSQSQGFPGISVTRRHSGERGGTPLATGFVTRAISSARLRYSGCPKPHRAATSQTPVHERQSRPGTVPDPSLKEKASRVQRDTACAGRGVGPQERSNEDRQTDPESRATCRGRAQAQAVPQRRCAGAFAGSREGCAPEGPGHRRGVAPIRAVSIWRMAALRNAGGLAQLGDVVCRLTARAARPPPGRHAQGPLLLR